LNKWKWGRGTRGHKVVTIPIREMEVSVEEGNSTEVMGEPKSTRFVIIIFSHYDLS
jgi:hypothetical protein